MKCSCRTPPSRELLTRATAAASPVPTRAAATVNDICLAASASAVCASSAGREASLPPSGARTMAERCEHTHVRLISKEGHVFVVDTAAASVSKLIASMMASGVHHRRRGLNTVALTPCALCSQLHGGAARGSKAARRAWRARSPLCCLLPAADRATAADHHRRAGEGLPVFLPRPALQANQSRARAGDAAAGVPHRTRDRPGAAPGASPHAGLVHAWWLPDERAPRQASNYLDC